MSRGRVTTCTTLVLAALRERDDLLRYDELQRATGEPYNRVNAALFELLAHRAVGVVVDGDGARYWYALPSQEDDRIRVVTERVREEPGSRRRRRPSLRKSSEKGLRSA